MRQVVLAFGLVCAVGAALGAEFEVVGSRDGFLRLIEGRKLTRFGIQLDVTASGGIGGVAFGVPVTGDWRWQDGCFCRDLKFGERDLGPNCQQVQVRDNVLRFISDQGKGPYADLWLR